MTTFLMSLLFVFSASANVIDSNAIVAAVNTMDKHSNGVYEYDGRGDTAYEILLNSFMDEDGYDTEKEAIEDGGFLVDSDYVEYGDNADFGTITADAARSLLAQSVGIETHDIDEEDGKVLDAELDKLIKAGAKFGTRSAGGYCGITFPGLIVVDEATKKVYVIALAPSGEC